MSKPVDKMSIKELREVKRRSWNEDIGLFDSIVILPCRSNHDSGFRNMEFVACKDNHPYMRFGGGSDCIHLDGIGGVGYEWSKNPAVPYPPSVSAKDVCIDCLPVSGCLRIFGRCRIAVGADLSSMEVYFLTKEEQAKYFRDKIEK